MKCNESTALLQRSTSEPSLHQKQPVLVTQALPRFSEPVAKEVRKAEREKNKRKSNRFRIIKVDSSDVLQPQKQTQSEPIPLNPQSHYVRTTQQQQQQQQQKKKKKSTTPVFPMDEYTRLEQRLIASIQINDQLEDEVNRNIAIAYQKQLLRVPMIAFMRYGTEFQFVKDIVKLSTYEYDIVYTKNSKTISKKQLSLDLFHHEHEYRTIVSVILYMESLKPPLTYVISRYPIMVTPKVPDLFLADEEEEEDSATTTTTTTTVTTTRTTTTTTTTKNNHVTSLPPSFMERLYLNCTCRSEPGFYYLIYADLSLTRPEPL